MAASNFLFKYSWIGFGYGGVRKAMHVFDAQVTENRYSQPLQTSPMYMTTKCYLVAYGAGLGSVFWPAMVLKDMHEIEAHLRGDREEGRVKTIDDYILQ